MTDAPLETALGQYRLIARLGQGGMAEVYLACTEGPGGFQKLLVLKIARYSDEPGFSAMFLDEARLAARLSHPNVVETYQVGEDGDRHYLVMEYLDGPSLVQLRRKAIAQGGIPLRFSLQILSHVLDALDYAHAAHDYEGNRLNVVHRDLTPHNIMITVQGVVKILDFGIAKAADNLNVTQTGFWRGKVSYVPPEQLRGEPVDHRADIFTVGVILAEAVTGQPYWGELTGPAVATRLAAGDLPVVQAPEQNPELMRICARALAPDRENRYESAAQFKVDLDACLRAAGGPVPRGELAKFASTLFAPDRARIRAIIDRQLKGSAQLPSGIEGAEDLPRLEGSSGKRTALSGGRPRSSGALPEQVTQADDLIIDVDQESFGLFAPASAATGESQPLVARPQSALGSTAVALIAASIVIAGLLVALAVVAFRPSPQPEARVAVREPTPAIQPPQAPVAAPAPVPALPQPATSRVEILVSPPEATLTLDGEALHENPFVGLLPSDRSPHVLSVAAKGYQPLVRRFTLEKNVLLQLRLQQSKSRPTHHVSRPPGKVRPAVSAAPDRELGTLPPPTPQQPPVAESVSGGLPVDSQVLAKSPPETKRPPDGDLSQHKPSREKRTLDPNVFDDHAEKPALDRDNPWK